MSYYNRYKPFAPYIRSMKYYYIPIKKTQAFKSTLDQFYFARPSIAKTLTEEYYSHATDDLTEQKNYDETEGMRPFGERDFYQDNTYHNQWLTQELNDEQKQEIGSRYPFFAPNYKNTPWIFYPGDQVEIVDGEYAGQRGAILGVFAYKNEVTVQNVNVKTVNLPGGEDRPAQELEREHPVPVHRLKHVDPNTNKVTDLRIVTVKSNGADGTDGTVERRRITLESGAILPIPREDFTGIEGDPLLDTPMMDAEEETYDAVKEMNTLVERKLQAMEKGFVKRLKTSYEFHKEIKLKNEDNMRSYQRDVVDRAEELVLAKL